VRQLLWQISDRARHIGVLFELVLQLCDLRLRFFNALRHQTQKERATCQNHNARMNSMDTHTQLLSVYVLLLHSYLLQEPRVRRVARQACRHLFVCLLYLPFSLGNHVPSTFCISSSMRHLILASFQVKHINHTLK
jgi:hypothetical protein